MVVADQHGVNRWQAVEFDARQPMAARPEERDRAAPHRPNRVGENVAAGLLQEHRRVIHQSSQQRGRIDRLRRDGRRDRNQFRRWLLATIRHPFEHVGEAAGFTAAGIEEPAAAPV